MYKIVEKLEWGPFATFIPNKHEPVYDWFYYKEGFSKQLVFNVLDMFGANGLVLDPFCGVGTTLVACKQRGIDSLGFDVSPIAVFVSNVKLREYDPDELFQAIKRLMKIKFVKKECDVSSFVKKAFSKYVLDDIFVFRDAIMRFEDEKIRDFLLLGLMNAAMKCSYVIKDGSVLRIKKKPVPPLRKMLRRTLMKMLHDVKTFETTEAKAEARIGDARMLDMEDESVDAVITSPPYLNKIEYTRVYSIETELFFKHMKTTAIRSAIGLDTTADFLVNKDLPPIARAYFKDMDMVIHELYRVCKQGAKVAIVVGNGCFPDGVVESDIILSEIAESVGFAVDRIIVLNKRWCTKQRTKKIGITRESMIVLTK
ncbi:MAG: hypothetical protein J7K68_04190 [Candidatus Diapherotrites archaeon]|nr:hypothetical protein [Candidatus Diapherotrites archaeon]